MPPKSKAHTTPDTSATAKPASGADVLATAAVPATAEAITPPPAEGAISVGDAQVAPPLEDVIEGAATVLPAAANAEGPLAVAVETIVPSDDDDLPKMTHEIKATDARGFCRAGRRWPQAGVPVNQADWSDEQWASLIDEPMLIVRPL